MVQVVSLTGALSYAGEHGVTAVGLGHVVDELHDQHGLAHASTTEQTCNEGKKKKKRLKL